MTTSADTHTLLTDGIVLAGASAFVYLATFLYEYGYCSHFGIPATLISPNLTTVLVGAAALGGVFVSSFYYLGLTAPLFAAARDPRRRPYRHVFALAATLAAAAILLIAIYGFSWSGIILFAVVVAFFALIAILQPILSNRSLPVEERFARDADLQDKDPFLFTSLLEVWFGRRLVSLGVLAVGMLGLAYLVGHGEATRKERFLTLKAEPDLVVLRNYGELLVTARFSREKRQLLNELKLIWLSEKKQADFRNEFVGPLTVEPRAVVKPVLVPSSATSAWIAYAGGPVSSKGVIFTAVNNRNA